MNDRTNSELESRRVEKDTQVSGAISRRKFVVGAAAPAILSIVSKPVMASSAVCNISGFTSVHPSGVTRHTQNGSCGGISSDVWAQPYSVFSGGLPSAARLQMWVDAGTSAGVAIVPQMPLGLDQSWIDLHIDLFGNAPATLFSDVFSGGDGVLTLSDVLNSGSLLQQSAVAAYLSSHYLNWDTDHFKINSSDIVGLHDAWINGASTYITSENNVVNVPNESELIQFFTQLA